MHLLTLLVSLFSTFYEISIIKFLIVFNISENYNTKTNFNRYVTLLLTPFFHFLLLTKLTILKFEKKKFRV